MPVTRRRRATSPEQPENNSSAAQAAEQTAGSPTEASGAEQLAPEQAASSEASAAFSETNSANASALETPSISATEVTDGADAGPSVPQESLLVEKPKHEPVTSKTEEAPADLFGARPTSPEEVPTRQEPPAHRETPTKRSAAARAAAENPPYQPVLPTSSTNGERTDRTEYPPIEGGRRTARGEFFRRPPQLPSPLPYAQQQPVVQQAAPPAPTHEINLPLGNLLHLAYNPGYTGSDEARSALLNKLQNESKAGGRARCWSCGSLAIVYERWNTRSKTFGEVGIAFCEICGVWSVM